MLPVELSLDPLDPPIHRQHTTLPVPSTNPSKVFGKGPKDESVLSFRSNRSSTSNRRFTTAKATPLPSSGPTSPTTQAAQTVEGNLAAEVSRLSLGEGAGSSSAGDGAGSFDSGRADGDNEESVRVAFLTEQVSHHPPISAYYATCPARGVTLMGVDQIAARVSGTGVRIAPGDQNKGIFVRIEDGPGKGEMYQVTHPTAMVNGLLRGNFYVTVGESTIITCSGAEGVQEGTERLRVIIEYKEEVRHVLLVLSQSISLSIFPRV